MTQLAERLEMQFLGHMAITSFANVPGCLTTFSSDSEASTLSSKTLS